MPFRSPTPFDQRHLAKGGTRGPMTAFVLRTFREQFFRELGDGKQERSAPAVQSIPQGQYQL